MIIRHSTERDLPEILAIYEAAREYMRSYGNPDQWGTGWPPEDEVQSDIRNGVGYVAEENGEIVGVFHYRFGENPEETYSVIEGQWLSDTPYGVVHRIAAKVHGRGIGEGMLRWAVGQAGHLRIDTHELNAPMQALLQRLGFTYCGIIYVREHDPRMAYEILPRA